jgi:hypothetical protein
MARDVKEDFDFLWEFVQTYSLHTSAAVPGYKSLLSMQHKRYHGFLTLLSEIEHRGWVPLAQDDSRSPLVNRVFQERLVECASDLAHALFAWLHGAYKSARVMLRSAIENFFKCVGVTEHDDIIALRNTFEVVDRVGHLAFFLPELHQRRFSQLRDAYAVLCLDVHTATVDEMEHVGALSFFPRFDAEAADDTGTLYVRVTSAVLEILCLMFPPLYSSMHYRNRDIINLSLADEVRAALNRRDHT